MTDWTEVTSSNARSVQTTIGWIFWDPGAVDRYRAAGLPDGLTGPLGYIAARCAPLAAAGPEAVTAAFGSISPQGITAVFDLLDADGFAAMWTARNEAVATGLAGDVSWIAVSWHDTRQTPNPATTGATGGSGGPGTFQPLQVLDAPVAMASKSNGLMGSYGFLETLAQGAGTPFLNTGQQGNTPWGDYEGMGVDRSGSVPSFYPAWGDNRDGLTTTQVWVASYLP